LSLLNQEHNQPQEKLAVYFCAVEDAKKIKNPALAGLYWNQNTITVIRKLMQKANSDRQ
jgi:hypothetical protein